MQIRGSAPAPVILDYAEKNDIDQIVAGTKGRRRDDRAFLGSVTEEVVQSAKCPILTINDSTKFENIESKNNILVPIDFSISAGYCRSSKPFGENLNIVNIST